LYIKRKDEGRGLISVEDCVRQEEAGSDEYVLATDERMLVIARKLDYGREAKATYRKRKDEKRKTNWVEKPLHGRFLREMDKQATERTFQWVRGGYTAKRRLFLLLRNKH